MNCVVCFGDSLIFAKCIISCVHWLAGFQTPILRPTVANKLHIYYLKQIIGQWIVGSVSVNAQTDVFTSEKSLKNVQNFRAGRE